MRNTSQPITPFLKWAGGKRWLLSAHSTLFPTQFERYIEPFLGSAAVFFYLNPKFALLSDTNFELVETYKAIKRSWKKVHRLLSDHHRLHSKAYYYRLRKAVPLSAHERAARFIYLNRTCWNGLYRVNLKGRFNVPIGTKKNVLMDTDDFPLIAKRLRNTELHTGDFESVIAQASDNDFLYADPPYTVIHNTNGFLKYNEKIFNWNDQLRLRDSLFRAKDRGAQVIVSNADSESIREIYQGFGTLLPLWRHSVLAGDSNKRRRCSELIITSWRSK